MDGHYDVGCFSSQHTLQKGALCTMAIESMPAIENGSESVGVFYESVGNTGIPEECLETVARLEVGLDSALCTAGLDIAHSEFLCVAKCFVEVCPADADDVFFGK